MECGPDSRAVAVLRPSSAVEHFGPSRGYIRTPHGVRLSVINEGSWHLVFWVSTLCILFINFIPTLLRREREWAKIISSKAVKQRRNSVLLTVTRCHTESPVVTNFVLHVLSASWDRDQD